MRKPWRLLVGMAWVVLGACSTSSSSDSNRYRVIPIKNYESPLHNESLTPMPTEKKSVHQRQRRVVRTFLPRTSQKTKKKRSSAVRVKKGKHRRLHAKKRSAHRTSRVKTKSAVQKRA